METIIFYVTVLTEGLNKTCIALYGEPGTQSALHKLILQMFNEHLKYARHCAQCRAELILFCFYSYYHSNHFVILFLMYPSGIYFDIKKNVGSFFRCFASYPSNTWKSLFFPSLIWNPFIPNSYVYFWTPCVLWYSSNDIFCLVAFINLFLILGKLR